MKCANSFLYTNHSDIAVAHSSLIVLLPPTPFLPQYPSLSCRSTFILDCASSSNPIPPPISLLPQYPSLSCRSTFIPDCASSSKPLVLICDFPKPQRGERCIVRALIKPIASPRGAKGVSNAQTFFT